MTVDQRARRAASAVHAAVGQVEPPPLLARRRLQRKRVVVSVVFAILAAPAGLALVNAARDGGGPSDISFVEDDQKPDGSDAFPRPDPGHAVDERVVSDDRAISGTTGRAPSLEGTGRTQAEERPPSVKAPPATGCEGRIIDRKGDVDNAAIDILRSSISYSASTNDLVIHHIIDDIPDTPPFPNEALAYEYYFTVDGTWYMVMAYIRAGQSDWSFSVQRRDRTRAEQWPDVPRQIVMSPTGRVDTEKDTVTISIDIDEFNQGERVVAAQEGFPPAAVLRRGSTLTNISLTAYPRSAGVGPYDDAIADCWYIVGQRAS